MVSEDSANRTFLPPVHRLDDSRNLQETVDREMATLFHELENLRELLEILSLRRQERILREEWNDHFVKIANRLTTKRYIGSR